MWRECGALGDGSRVQVRRVCCKNDVEVTDRPDDFFWMNIDSDGLHRVLVLRRCYGD
jgi:hypothetical protein